MNLLFKIKHKFKKKEDITHKQINFDDSEYKHQMTLVNLAEMGVSVESIQSYDTSIKKINEFSRMIDSYIRH